MSALDYSILKLMVTYYMIGTFYLICFVLGFIRLTMTRKRDGKVFINPPIFVISICLYWPVLLWFNIQYLKGDKDENTK